MANSNYFLLQIITVLLLSWMALSDLQQRKVPNIAVILFAVVVGAVTPLSQGNVLISVVVLSIGMLAFHFRLFGAGDSKLLAVCAYGAGDQWTSLIFITALFGGVLSVMCWIHNWGVQTGFSSKPPVKTVPYAVAICGAAFATLHYM
ncbi:TPA: prepilin peptidase [Vibrio cholerae]|uniref:A24 family peptidase n=1 Tax=Vibrio cholerae TaxID=666 RepID=UPI0009B51C9A|nr:prepilin peptidase [Vibrio cholerae]EGR2026569.1 pilus assembly protein PilD [Vibrio cholerae]EGR3967209.1 pilus assembly protein PilD [Vibrio cholerae]ELJ8616257.1 prepilin peptidase [Vibrio cholerae]ELJ8695338.1 prepilin peptidase [Vibrio cholerae]HDZ9126182.1 prepilin peptidase [Vibrio cholerae]